jgi:hypothetical protein
MHKQRQFPLLACMPKPHDAPQKVVALCESESAAVATSLLVCKSHRKPADVARMLGISRAYLSMLKSGARSFPDDGGRLAAAFCIATGCNLLNQYNALQHALRASQATSRERDVVAELAAMAQASWSREAVA